MLRVMDNDMVPMDGGVHIDSLVVGKPEYHMQGTASITPSMSDGHQGIQYRLAKRFDGTSFTDTFKYLLCGYSPINECDTALVDVVIKGRE